MAVEGGPFILFPGGPQVQRYATDTRTRANPLHGFQPLTYNRTGLLDLPEKAWSQDGGNMRVFAHEVTC